MVSDLSCQKLDVGLMLFRVYDRHVANCETPRQARYIREDDHTQKPNGSFDLYWSWRSTSCSTQGVVRDFKRHGLGKAFFSGDGLFVFKVSGSGIMWITSFGALVRKDVSSGPFWHRHDD